jgi:hypothetical protein
LEFHLGDRDQGDDENNYPYPRRLEGAAPANSASLEQDDPRYLPSP